MKYIHLIVNVFLIILAANVAAQESSPDSIKYGWTKEMLGGLNLTQTSFDNWSQGGENTMAWQVNLNFKFINDQEKTNWSNTGKFSYGFTKSGKDESKKSIDEIKLESVLTYKLNVYVNPFIAVSGLTQFDTGYKYTDDSKTKVSAFMDPGYIRESIGVGYEPNKIVKTRVGAALKHTITSNYPVPYADDPETDEIEKTKTEFGAESVTDVSWQIAEDMQLTSKLELFSAFKAWDRIDVDWDTLLSVKVSKYFNVIFNVKLFYDKDISPKRQLKQSLAMGLTYSFL